ncbi:MAG TPA: mechanosensitive ion channel family protein, partial [Thiothrix sp.]|nr:mechanosensitive ion channel family protein [Thiothrix sp.]
QKAESLKNNTAPVINQVANDKPLALRIVDQIPDELRQSLLGLAFWQWLGILLFIILGIIADTLYRWLSVLIMRYFIRNSHRVAYQNLPDDMLRPFGLMVMAFIWWLGLNFLLLPEAAFLILILAVKFLISISGVWGAYRLVDLVHAWFRYHSSQTANKWDDALVPLVRRTLKIFVTVIGLIFIADTLQINLTGLLAGLGLGGLAFALAAKDIAQNLFGTITILVERTFSVGDWVIINDVEGTVEDISFRSTRIRTFYDSIVTLPNSNMITSPVDNQGERRYRRFKTTLSLTYETPPDKIDTFCEGVREIIRLHPYMRKDNYQVYFNGYNESGLDILVYVFWQTPDWATELREKHRFLLDILRLAQALSVDFAYPTQTVYWKAAEKANEQDQSNNPSNTTQAQTDPLSRSLQNHAGDCDQARQTARQIVCDHLDLEQKPEPVTIETQPLSQNSTHLS